VSRASTSSHPPNRKEFLSTLRTFIAAQQTFLRWTMSMTAGWPRLRGRTRCIGKDHDRQMFGTRGGPKQLVHMRLGLRLKPSPIHGCAQCNKALRMLQLLCRSTLCRKILRPLLRPVTSCVSALMEEDHARLRCSDLCACENVAAGWPDELTPSMSTARDAHRNQRL